VAPRGRRPASTTTKPLDYAGEEIMSIAVQVVAFDDTNEYTQYELRTVTGDTHYTAFHR
jgi:hypothetical protein